MTIDSSLSYLEFNIGLCYLVKDSVVGAYDWYIQAITHTKKQKLPSRQRQELAAAMKDLDAEKKVF